ncbi:hypothetical protein XENOCAPTIV_029313 [Xenoophorus captivus]|uniref:Uncharacterized protein n=1 Tax=Xenoophorus captivus TaxID=1517983 RepID=A0ABV0RE54_9TELE
MSATATSGPSSGTSSSPSVFLLHINQSRGIITSDSSLQGLFNPRPKTNCWTGQGFRHDSLSSSVTAWL